MYKKLRILAFLIVAMLMSACQKDLILDGTSDVVVDAAETITLKQEGETKVVAFTTLSGKWSVDQGSYDRWLTVEKKDGKLVVAAQANNLSDERQTQITLNTVSGKYSMAVTQFGTAPYISIEGSNGTAVYNHEAHTAIALNVITNTDNWRVEQVNKEKNSWLSYEVNLKEHKLLLNLTAINRNSEWAQTSRNEKLFLTNGNKHYLLNVVQNGYVQFQLPVWDFDNFKLDRVVALEGERNNIRDLAFERDFLLPYNVEQEKMYYVFHSPGEQAPHILYSRNYYTGIINTAWLKAPKGETFKKESLESWLTQNNFKQGNKQRNEDETEFYCEENEKTRLLHIYNAVENYSWMGGGLFKSACMKYIESPNELRLTDGSISSFPIGGSQHLNDKKFKLEQIIEFEKKRGMKPDYHNEFNSEQVTTEIQDPLCKYSKLLFVPENPSNDAGSLAYVIYYFNWQGVTKDDIDAGLRGDAEYSGTVGLCQVFYTGGDLFYERKLEGEPGVWEYYVTKLRRNVRIALEQKGYGFVREDDSGYVTFYRGEEDLIDMRPQSTRTVISYYKSKHYVDIIKKRFNL